MEGQAEKVPKGERLHVPGERRGAELSMDPSLMTPVLPDQLRTCGAERVSVERHREKRRCPAFEGQPLHLQPLL